MKTRVAFAGSSRGLMVCLVLSLIITLLCSVVLPAASVTAASSPEYFKMESVKIKGAEGTNLPAHLYIPVTEKPKGGYPAVVFIHSWMCNQWEYEIPMMKLAKKGYITICYDCRGWNMAGGQIGTAGEKELLDVNKVVDWLIDNTEVNPDKIGSCGVSYGGGQSLLALKFEPRIKTVVALSCWADLQEGLAPDDSAKSLWDIFLIGTAAFRADPEMFEWLQSYLLDTKKIKETRADWKIRSAQTYIDDINDRDPQPSMFIINGMNDDLFTTRQVVKFYEDFDGEKKLMLANGIHGSAEGLGILGMKSDVMDQTYDWFDYHLKGIDNDIMDAPRLSLYQKWTSGQGLYDDWPVPADDMRLYVNEDGLSESRGDSSTATIKNVLSSASSGVPMISPALDTFKIPWYGVSKKTLNSTKGSMAFETESLDEITTVIGTPYMHASIVPNKKKYQLNFMIYDVDKDGTSKLVQHSSMTERNGDPNDERQIDLGMNVVSYQFKEGHRIRLVISSQDLGFVLPLGYPFDVKFKLGNSGTYLDLPIVENRNVAK